MTDDYYLALAFPAVLFFIMMIPFIVALVWLTLKMALESIFG